MLICVVVFYIKYLVLSVSDGCGTERPSYILFVLYVGGNITCLRIISNVSSFPRKEGREHSLGFNTRS